VYLFNFKCSKLCLQWVDFYCFGYFFKLIYFIFIFQYFIYLKLIFLPLFSFAFCWFILILCPWSQDLRVNLDWLIFFLLFFLIIFFRFYPSTLSYSNTKPHNFIQFSFKHDHPSIMTGSKILPNKHKKPRVMNPFLITQIPSYSSCYTQYLPVCYP
jgi:hypothetical protein